MFKLLSDDIALIDERSPEDVFIKISQSVSNLIRISNSRFSIGIYGEWGKGKTTLMRMTERQLNSFLSNDAISLSWIKLVRDDSNEMRRLKEFLKK
jgi:ABC-type Na+ transport system ATPase subunit NatA